MQQADVETAFRFLVSQSGVRRDAIRSVGVGWLGVDISYKWPPSIPSLVLISGETLRPGSRISPQGPQFPELFVVANSYQYPPTVEAMLLLYARSSSPARKLIHYSGVHDVPLARV